jgi:nucleoside-diphosphate-sugar epimerase
MPLISAPGRPTTVAQIAQILAEGLGKDVSRKSWRKYREGDIRHCVPISRVRANCWAFEPKVALEQGIPELLAWVSEQEASDRSLRRRPNLKPCNWCVKPPS